MTTIRSFITLALGSSLLLTACFREAPKADAYGNFEAEEWIVSAEANGHLVSLKAEEGQQLKAGDLTGQIDAAQLELKKEQLRAAIRAVAAKSPQIDQQLRVFEKQLSAVRQQISTLQREKQRVENLLRQDAATPKQLDDLNAQLDQAQKQADVILEQKSASNSALSTQKGGLLAEILPLEKQIAQLDDQIARCSIRNPIDGVVLTLYARQGEVTSFGKPLYKIADLRRMTLRAYVSGDQLGSIRLGQDVTIRIDAPGQTYKELPGKITWVSGKAEFTPKIVQTKDERVNLVYAIKISAANDGTLKIGMPAEVKF